MEPKQCAIEGRGIQFQLAQLRKEIASVPHWPYELEILGDLTVPSIHQGLQTVDLFHIVDVDLKGGF